jgi:hypothetical protein
MQRIKSTPAETTGDCLLMKQPQKKAPFGLSCLKGAITAAGKDIFLIVG